ncbi:unnamed protein product [Meloidogyne enterolobii]|uniref:Uncharacterized protein n=1 Tax=Meloidogyne enterolobii TaxID=390850 RepID=A0ACB1AHU1_MELEN
MRPQNRQIRHQRCQLMERLQNQLNRQPKQQYNRPDHQTRKPNQVHKHQQLLPFFIRMMNNNNNLLLLQRQHPLHFTFSAF